MSCSSLIHGDCLYMMPELAQDSVDAIVTDPPYGLTGDGKGGFMGKEWDGCVPGVEFWKRAIRVAKPGAWLLAFGGTRTYHRLACAIEDAGWEIRDCIMWVFGGGWPKSLNIAKAIDRHNGYEGNVVGTRKVDTSMQGGNLLRGVHRRNEVEQEVRELSPEASKWDGFGTCLKPAYEPILVARKPLDGTVINNVLKHGTGALNIDACRVPLPDGDNLTDGIERNEHKADTQGMGYNFVSGNRPAGVGRFPANLIHDGSPEVLELFPESRGQQGSVTGKEPSETTRGIYGKFSGNRKKSCPRGDSGSAARFFYCAKASRAERGEGNTHITVKPLALMRYLVTLVAPPGSVVMDPFMGSGTTGVACMQTGHGFIGIEQEKEYFEIAKKRISETKQEET